MTFRPKSSWITTLIGIAPPISNSRQVVDTGDDLDDEERKRLHRALDAAIESVQAGRTVDGNEVIRRLLSRS